MSEDLKCLLCDFGLARTASEATSVGLEGEGSVRWKSPEIMEKEGGKTFSSDVWAFGMLIYEVCRELIPFPTLLMGLTVLRF